MISSNKKLLNSPFTIVKFTLEFSNFGKFGRENNISLHNRNV